MRPPVLPPGASPAPLSYHFTAGDTVPVARHRMTSCRNYSTCLTFVVRVGWTNFSCRRCALFAQEAGPPPVDNLIQLVVESMERKGPTDASPRP